MTGGSASASMGYGNMAPACWLSGSRITVYGKPPCAYCSKLFQAVAVLQFGRRLAGEADEEVEVVPGAAGAPEGDGTRCHP